MAEFVRAQIFGTTFEITSRYDARDLTRRIRLTRNRYSDLQPVGMGAFGLVWCVDSPLTRYCIYAIAILTGDLAATALRRISSRIKMLRLRRS
jgi:p38 MAP kinase